ncbi:CRISPR-associated protein Cmr6 [Planifilum fimeticola]|uniref:CRISPR-associated protein Cmr6 n=1 Tax=Planifilum fimeticola TaxID=201975 RepID=A0A2T0L9Z7_9BACL|nr:type III-B CRISPR module RAMP protein Cmr6 [Planifilum fimeticola]PRX38547.1 CRISPR-associated protein Cmr6 [Planifilum fimeticola]
MKGRTPLYKGGRGFPHKIPDTAHTGLWYDKFCNRWEVYVGKNSAKNFWELGNRKADWIQTVTKKRCGDKLLIQEAVERMEALVRSHYGLLMYARTEGRFVTGLGRSHPVENGFVWHPVLGTPYLPGSSVKGMVRAWAEEWTGDSEIDRIFGSKHTDSSKRIGSVVFFDALPRAAVKLEIDVMTPHFADYYRDPQKNPPVERYAPIPIPFLTVSGGQSFVFAVAPRKKEDQRDVDKVMNWLKEALEWIGAGAKTSVGYGRFVVEGQK